MNLLSQLIPTPFSDCEMVLNLLSQLIPTQLIGKWFKVIAGTGSVHVLTYIFRTTCILDLLHAIYLSKLKL